MENNAQNIKGVDSEAIPFDISNLSSLQYIKIIFFDKRNKLHEIQTESNKIDSAVIQLHLSSEKQFDVNCPTGAVLKFITANSILFSKTVLKAVRNVENKVVFILETPQKTIQQQNRKFYRISKDRPCVMLFRNEKTNGKTYIAQTVNISKGGVLLYDVESLLDYQKRKLKLMKGDYCYIAMFLKHNVRIKSKAQFVRDENVNESYRYAFQFVDMPEEYFEALDKYITSEEFKLMQSIKQN